MIKAIIIVTTVASVLFLLLSLSIYITFTRFIKLKRREKFMIAILSLTIIAFIILYNIIFSDVMLR